MSALRCFITSKAKLKRKGRRARRAAWWPRCAARRWRAVDRGADSAAAPSHAAGRVASSAPKQTRARGAAAAAKTSTSTSPSLLVSSRLVAGAHVREARQGRRVRSAKAAIRTRSHPARRQRAAAKGAALASWRCCCLGSTICTAERGGARQYTAEAASDDVSYLFAPVEA